MSLIDKTLILTSLELKTRDEVFELIAKKISSKHKIPSKDIIKSLQAREAEFSTGIGNGIAIPHASLKIKNAEIVVINTKSIDWKAIDNKKVNLVVCLLVPSGKVGREKHFEMLTKISKSMLKQEFIQALRSGDASKIEVAINNTTNEKSLEKKSSKTNKSIVGITSCATGIAHTYMAAEVIEKGAKDLGYNVKVEKRGGMGVENKLSPKDISDASYCIIASEVNVDASLFAGKPTYVSSASEAIKNPETYVKTAIKKAKVQKGTLASSNVLAIAETDEAKGWFRKLMDHMLFGVSWMLPFVVVSGILLGFVNIITSIVFVPGGDWGLWDGHWFMQAMIIIGQAGFGVMFGVFSGAMAYSISGKPGAAVGFISGMLITNSSFIFVGFENLSGLQDIADKGIHAGFFGAIFTGWFTGYVVNQLKKFEFGPTTRALMPVLIIPLFLTFFNALLIKFVIGLPLAYLMYGIYLAMEGMAAAGPGVIWIVGFVFGAAACFDLGGPINKTAFAVALGLFFTNTGFSDIWQPYAAFHIAIPIASIGALFAHFMTPKLWPETMKVESTTATAMACFGISEGAIPIAISNPKVWIPANMIGGGVAGSLVILLGARTYGGVAGPFMMFLGAGDSAYGANWSIYIIWPLVTVVGAFITAIIAIFLAKQELKKTSNLSEEEIQAMTSSKLFSKVKIGGKKGKSQKVKTLLDEQEIVVNKIKTKEIKQV